MKLSDRALILLHIVDEATDKDWTTDKYIYAITEKGRCVMEDNHELFAS